MNLLQRWATAGTVAAATAMPTQAPADINDFINGLNALANTARALQDLDDAVNGRPRSNIPPSSQGGATTLFNSYNFHYQISPATSENYRICQRSGVGRRAISDNGVAWCVSPR